MINEPQLLVENWGQPFEIEDVNSDQLVESTGKRPGLYIEGIFLQANVVNRNKRMYPKTILESAIDQYVKEQVKTNQALGELNHPPRAMVDPMQAAIIIEDMWWKGDNVYGRARVIEGDNGAGDKLAALIRSGWKPGVSSRGLGRVKDSGKGYNIVQEGFRLTVGVDVVWGPSAPDAWVKPIQINENENPLQTENTIVESNDNAFNELIARFSAL